MSTPIDPKAYFAAHVEEAAFFARETVVDISLGHPGQRVETAHGPQVLKSIAGIVTDRDGRVEVEDLDVLRRQYGNLHLTDKEETHEHLGAPFRAVRVKEAVSFQTAWGEDIKLAPGDMLLEQKDAAGKTYYDGFSADAFAATHVRTAADGFRVVPVDMSLDHQARAVKNNLGKGNAPGRAHLQDIEALRELGATRSGEVPKTPGSGEHIQAKS
ncbi:MAG: hypothetical protein PW734_07315 [Verrucomicrobium sp.]|nr:hypothetical protein [Verrucomicrobium sp.]